MQEFIALAKAKPGQLNYASAGGGSASHLGGELFNTLTKVDIQHVPYKGGAPALIDLLGGHVEMSYQSPIAVLSYVKEGKLKAIGFGNDTRLPALPDVPTFAEAGIPGFQLKIWFGILAPAGTPQPIVDKLSAEIARVLAAPSIREKLVSQGADPFPNDPAQFAELLRADKARFDALIKTANIKFAN
jgi:tripartite-type tricarboxylate transporter receptor subunit TctC